LFDAFDDLVAAGKCAPSLRLVFVEQSILPVDRVSCSLIGRRRPLKSIYNEWTKFLKHLVSPRTTVNYAANLNNAARHTKVGGLAKCLIPNFWLWNYVRYQTYKLCWVPTYKLCSVPDLIVEVHKRVVSVQTPEVLPARG
jgi:hypothetical protein